MSLINDFACWFISDCVPTFSTVSWEILILTAKQYVFNSLDEGMAQQRDQITLCLVQDSHSFHEN